jgi:hypothetical protein
MRSTLHQRWRVDPGASEKLGFLPVVLVVRLTDNRGMRGSIGGGGSWGAAVAVVGTSG